MADIEDDAALARFQYLVAHPAARRGRRVRIGTEAMRQHVALAQPLQHVAPARRREIEMGHHRQPDLLGDFERHVERRDAVLAAGATADPYLDADDEIAVR